MAKASNTSGSTSHSLRKHDIGPAVEKLKADLKAKGFECEPGERFGDQTEISVRNYQHSIGLLSDSIAGPRTIRSFDQPVHQKTRHENTDEYVKRLRADVAKDVIAAYPTRKHQGAQPVSRLSLSVSGAERIKEYEGKGGPISTAIFTIPNNGSGPTIGYGYDLGQHSIDDSIAVFRQVRPNLSAADIANIKALKTDHATGKAWGKYHANPKVYANILVLDEKEQDKLFEITSPKYINQVKQKIKVDLSQNEFDALVSLAYNFDISGTALLINQGKTVEAMNNMMLITKSGGHQMKGLANRRQQEVLYFMTGDVQVSAKP